MTLTRVHAIYGLALAFSMGMPLLRADVASNPYSTIVDRNPFGLKDPPPPPPPPSNEPPAAPPAKVTLTGLISMFGEPRALLEIFDEPGKGGGTPKKPILREGERMGPVEVVAINVDKNTVTIRNSGQETNLTFEVAKATGPGAPAPGAAPPPPLPGLPGLPKPTAGTPTVISQNGVNTGGGVTLMGGNADTPPVASPSVASYGQNTANYNQSGAPGGPLGNDTGLRSIPTRPLRTDTSQQGGSPPPLTREQAYLMMEANRLRPGAPPLPPTPLSPDIHGQPDATPGGPGQFPISPRGNFPRPGGR